MGNSLSLTAADKPKTSPKEVCFYAWDLGEVSLTYFQLSLAIELAVAKEKIHILKNGMFDNLESNQITFILS